MRVQAARPKQAEAVVDVGVIARPGEQLLDERHLFAGFGEMALHVAVRIPGGEGAGCPQLLFGRCDGKPHGDRVTGPGPAVPALDQRLGVTGARCRVVAQAGGRVAVHHRLAADDEMPAAIACGEKRFGG